jgi:hypothetical protein
MADNIEQLAGVPAGTEINGEIVVADYDEQGNLIGWHKEIKQ